MNEEYYVVFVEKRLDKPYTKVEFITTDKYFSTTPIINDAVRFSDREKALKFMGDYSKGKYLSGYLYVVPRNVIEEVMTSYVLVEDLLNKLAEPYRGIK